MSAQTAALFGNNWLPEVWRYREVSYFSGRVVVPLGECGLVVPSRSLAESGDP